MKNYFYILATFALLQSCGDSMDYPRVSTEWKITQIRTNKSNDSMNLYFVEPIDEKNLNISKTWFVDSLGKYNTGDVLSLQLIK